MKIYLIRHGKTKGNLEGRYIGTTDEPLCEAGSEALEQLADFLKQEKVQPAAVYVTPLIRTKETAERLFPGCRTHELYELRECDFGRFEGHNWKELSDDPEYQRWIDSGGTEPFPQGESREEFCRRCCSGFSEVMAAQFADEEQNSSDERNFIGEADRAAAAGCAEETLVFVVHGGTIMALLEAYAEPAGDYFDWQVKNASGYLVRAEKEEWKNNRRILHIVRSIPT